jgi:CHAT domain-containing protein
VGCAANEDPREAIREARRELDAVIQEIQALAGFDTFLAPPRFQDVAAAAAERPLVYAAHAEPGGLALIVREADVVHVPLDELTTGAVRDRVRPYLAAYAAYRADAESGLPAWNAELDAITEWLWEVVLEPVLTEADGERELVVIAGGLLGLLPLHAAWTEDSSTASGRRHALDVAVFAYAPNARAVSAARSVAERTTASKALVVVDPQPVSAPALLSARIEGAAAAAAFPSAATVLTAGEATVAGFDREAGAADVLHLACHGFARLDAPLDSGLLLAGNRWVTLRDLLAMTLNVRLAVLSACETSLPGTELPDEVVALPTGLLQAGVAGVIASQWAVPDLGTAILMTEFYRRRADTTPAAALRDAQQWVRDTTNAEKIDEWEQALAEGVAWLPAEAGEALIDRLAFRDPEARDHAELRTWAGFAYVGV